MLASSGLCSRENAGQGYLFPENAGANVSTSRISHYSHYESFLCLDLIAACAGLVSHVQAAAYKETDRGLYIIVFFLSTIMFGRSRL